MEEMPTTPRGKTWADPESNPLGDVLEMIRIARGTAMIERPRYPYRMRTLCPGCCSQDGLITIIGGQNVLRCRECDTYIKCVPKADWTPPATPPATPPPKPAGPTERKDRQVLMFRGRRP